MFLIVGFTSFCLFAFGFIIGAFVIINYRPRKAPLKRLQSSSIPSWELEYLASKVITSISEYLPSDDDREKLKLVSKQISLQIIPDNDEHIKVRTWGVFAGGSIVKIKDGKGWQRRFATVLAHSLHLLLKGDADNFMRDAGWFASALKPLKNIE